MYKITVITSSRADYSIYRPLLQLLKQKSEIELQIVAFGTHTSGFYGNTVTAIRKDGFDVNVELPFVLNGASPRDIAISMAKTMEQFADVWNTLSTDLIVCLGDRYEMFAAVAASVPFSIPIIHIHGGETTLGAIDNVFRHSLTQMATLHFASCEPYKQKIVELTGSTKNVHNTGALSIDNLKSLELLTVNQFKDTFGVDLNKPTILTTFHPETVSYGLNEDYATQICSAFQKLSADFQILITMPNADTMGNIIRDKLSALANNHKGSIFAFENLGTVGYLSAMKHCAMLVGNTSSGFVEASYFPKWVINLGNRQDGRLITENIYTIEISENNIVDTVRSIGKLSTPDVQHPYGNGNAAAEMVQHIIGYLKSNPHL